MTTFIPIEHPANQYIQALEELLFAYQKERDLRPIGSISKKDAQYSRDLKHRIRKLINTSDAQRAADCDVINGRVVI